MYIGVDIGSANSKIAIINKKNEMLNFTMIPTIWNKRESGEKVLNIALNEIGKSANEIQDIIYTGYGRSFFTTSNKVLPEIICHAIGTRFLFPKAKTIIDIGGQDSKIIKFDDNGNIAKFEMNDKCAAGTGRFLETLTEKIFNLDFQEMSLLSLKSRHPCVISSVCTVFAETEVISYLSEGRRKEDIIAGINIALAKRIISLGKAGQIDFLDPIIFSGGVANNIGVIRAFERILDRKIFIPINPQCTAALGAALYGKGIR